MDGIARCYYLHISIIYGKAALKADRKITKELISNDR